MNASYVLGIPKPIFLAHLILQQPYEEGKCYEESKNEKGWVTWASITEVAKLGLNSRSNCYKIKPAF